ncbi:MAG: hypothetical protein OHK0046_34770 [Anaerolineae bacterium]
MRRVLILLIVLLAAFWFIRADSPSAWQAWLMEGRGRLIVINQHGERLRTLTLPDQPDSPPVIASDRKFLAYCANHALVFFDLTTEQVMSRAPLPDCTLTSGLFNPLSTQFALAQQTTVTVFDVITGTTIAVHETESAVYRVEAFSGDVVSFSLTGDLSGMGWHWHTRTNALTATNRYPPTFSTSLSMTGERALVLHDPRLPGGAETGTPNTLSIADPTSHTLYPFMASDMAYFNRVWFVANGHALLVEAAPKFFLDRMWLLIGRDGHIIRPLRNLPRRDIHNTPEGFVYLRDADSHTELIHHHTGTLLPEQGVWRAEGHWHLLAVDVPSPILGMRSPWAQLADPVAMSPLPTSEAVVMPPMPSVYQIGGVAEVQTLDGEVLYLRAAPGTGHAIVLHLFDKMRVTLLEGPVRADGYRWWRIRTSDGTEGWAADAVEEITTLLPRAG